MNDEPTTIEECIKQFGMGPEQARYYLESKKTPPPAKEKPKGEK